MTARVFDESSQRLMQAEPPVIMNAVQLEVPLKLCTCYCNPLRVFEACIKFLLVISG
jgi:hypothetical protein